LPKYGSGESQTRRWILREANGRGVYWPPASPAGAEAGEVQTIFLGENYSSPASNALIVDTSMPPDQVMRCLPDVRTSELSDVCDAISDCH